MIMALATPSSNCLRWHYFSTLFASDAIRPLYPYNLRILLKLSKYLFGVCSECVYMPCMAYPWLD
jgi:hypothetical protein